MTACGLDFGTSNTTLGLVGAGRPELLALEGAHVTVPSAIFYGRVAAPVIGRAAIEAYVEGHEGRLFRSIKSVLGSALLDEVAQIGRTRAPFRQVLVDFLRHVKVRAEAAAGREITQVVHGRPVHFVDENPEGDAKAESALREIAYEVGFRDVLFQFEPIAAALDYEQSVEREELALIADIGGGTSDFSIVRIGPDGRRRADRTNDILANDGVRIGGTDFDRWISLRQVMPLLGLGTAMKRGDLDVPSSYFHDLASWHSINRLYDPKRLGEIRQVQRDAREPDKLERLVTVIEERRGHTLAGDVERAKIALADEPRARIALDWVERGLAAEFSGDELVENTEQLADRIGARITNCLNQAGIRPDDVDALFLTGGSTRLRHVRAAIVAELPKARVVEGDTFGSVGLGLTVDAMRRFGG
ncbi:Hsp70 family protein [Terrihabitans rhizophilus]|uniref:Hsp70 family protein n=1 Tax=Terrihabitans rhizophilus TaxID=3092662 RepID=A0ABU4RRG8_9HYPH|nr:Hsp70 family protein [Terrihabitans sp. PJ23]MDX6807441.1 Hsp70 family protein [Terrihabitans sp. PJ23]